MPTLDSTIVAEELASNPFVVAKWICLAEGVEHIVGGSHVVLR